MIGSSESIMSLYMCGIFPSEHSLNCLALTKFLWVESLVYYLGNVSNRNYIENLFSFKAVKRKNINKIWLILVYED